MKAGKLHQIIILLASTVALMAPLGASAQRGEKSLGIKAGYNTGNESGSGGLYFQYRFSRYFRIAPDVQYVFRRSGTDALSINCNAHVPLALGGPDSRFNFYPLAGVNFTSWNYHQTLPVEAESKTNGDDVSSRVNHLGLNVGGGIEYYVKPTLKLAVEGKYTMARHDDFGAVTLSIGYIF